MRKILITGATGQIGAALVPAIRQRYGDQNVIAAGHHRQPDSSISSTGPYCALDVRDRTTLREAVMGNEVDTVFHLASLLSAAAENDPQLAWDVNINGLRNVLEVARDQNCAVFFPSSISVFGPSTPLHDTPQDTIQNPNTMYGLTKVSGELLCNYYHHRFGLDTRGVRYPGLISHTPLSGNGTTDYAVEMFIAARESGFYRCYLKSDTQLDMMYMPDAVTAAVKLMEAEEEYLVHRNGYNITAMSFTPEQLAKEIRRHQPDFNIEYFIDPVRQAIADSWPRNMDDGAARFEWGWSPKFDLPAMATAMFKQLEHDKVDA